VVTPDRPSHFSLTTFVQWQDHEVTPKTRTRIMLQGMTDHEPADLVRLAKSWVRAPELKLTGGTCRGGAYDPAERAYRLEAGNPADAPSLSAMIAASPESPLENPAFIIRNWGRQLPVLVVNGESVPQGERFRAGVNRTADGDDLVIWLRLQATDPVTLSLEGAPKGAAPASR
jgi:hypothetical protein